MATTIETTKLYINGEKVFPTSSPTTGVIADYTQAGYISSDVEHIQDGYDLILNSKSTDINELVSTFGHKFLAYPDLQFSDYDDWNPSNIAIDNGLTSYMSFKNKVLNIKYVGNPYEHGVCIRYLKYLKELNIDNHCNFVWGEGLCRQNPILEKVTINVVGVENPEERQMNFENAFQEDRKLKEITMNWQDMSPFYYSTNLSRFCWNCNELKKFNNNEQIDFSEIYFSSEGVNITDMFSECWAMETLPQITGFYNVSNMSTMFIKCGLNYKNDTSKRVVDYDIDGIRNDVSMNGMFGGCPLIRSLNIHGENLPSEADIFGCSSEDWSQMNFDGTVPIYEEGTSNIIGYYIPDTFTQSLCTNFHLYVHPNNVEWWKTALKSYANEVLSWYIDNGMVQANED